MNEELKKLGFNEKETTVYLALLEFGTQPASIIAKKTKIPKTTILFLCDSLLKKGYITRSNKGATQYFTADPKDLEKTKEKEISDQKEALTKVLPILNEFKNPFSSPPKITFFEGIDACRKAYSLILESKDEAFEFGSHKDLEIMGYDWMQNFIKNRAKNNIFLHEIAKKDETHVSYLPLDKKQKRKQHLFSPKKGDLYSSIAIFEDKVLILNLYSDPFAILIQSPQVAETLKTIHLLARKGC